MMETILDADLPHSMVAFYEMKGIQQTIYNSFEATSPTTSSWTLKVEVKFSGMMALVSRMLEGVFKSQTDSFCQQFKAFAEKKYKE